MVALEFLWTVIAHIIPAAVLLSPVALAWWLSDGFKDLPWAYGSGLPLEVRALPKPSTHSVEVVNVDPFTGNPTRFPI